MKISSTSQLLHLTNFLIKRTNRYISPIKMPVTFILHLKQKKLNRRRIQRTHIEEK